MPQSRAPLLTKTAATATKKCRSQSQVLAQVCRYLNSDNSLFIYQVLEENNPCILHVHVPIHFALLLVWAVYTKSWKRLIQATWLFLQGRSQPATVFPMNEGLSLAISSLLVPWEDDPHIQVLLCNLQLTFLHKESFSRLLVINHKSKNIVSREHHKRINTFQVYQCIPSSRRRWSRQ